MILPWKQNEGKTMKTIIKDNIEGSFNIKTRKHNVMFSFFYKKYHNSQ